MLKNNKDNKDNKNNTLRSYHLSLSLPLHSPLTSHSSLPTPCQTLISINGVPANTY